MASEHVAFAFGQIVATAELRALLSTSEMMASYLRINEADSTVISHIRDYGTFLATWRTTGLHRAAALFKSATTGTAQVLVAASVPLPVSELLFEESVSRVRVIEQSAEDRLNKIDEITNKAGQGGLASGFIKTRDQAVRGARYWTAAVFLCVLSGIALPVYALSLDSEALKQLTGVAGLVVKSLSGLPVLALGAFSGHIAAEHRETARHLTVLAAQINSVQAYSNILPDDHKSDLIYLLGARAFTDPGFTLADAGKVPYVPEGMNELAKQVSGLIDKLRN